MLSSVKHLWMRSSCSVNYFISALLSNTLIDLSFRLVVIQPISLNHTSPSFIKVIWLVIRKFSNQSYFGSESRVFNRPICQGIWHESRTKKYWLWQDEVRKCGLHNEPCVFNLYFSTHWHFNIDRIFKVTSIDNKQFWILLFYNLVKVPMELHISVGLHCYCMVLFYYEWISFHHLCSIK